MNLPALLVLTLLAVECLAFLVLIAPQTYSIRHNLVKFLETPIAKQGLHGWRISMIGVSVLFADSIRSLLQKHEVSTDLTMNDKIAIGKMTAQRNFYLCGFSLFLALYITVRRY